MKYDIHDRMAAFISPDYNGVGFQEREMPCRSCGKSMSIRIVYFVDIDRCPAYGDALRTDWVERNDCSHCGDTARTRSPVIVDCPTQNLLIFATHGGDDAGLEQGFERWLQFVDAVVPDDVSERISDRPYTFVHGWEGLGALLDILNGKPLCGAAPPYSHDVDDEQFTVALLDGYAFGPLQFWHPQHRAIEWTTHMLLGLAAQATTERERRWMIAVLDLAIDILGEQGSHLWLEEELGRQSLLLGDRAKAREHLLRAQALSHTWIALTASFLDATPTRRASGAIHGEDLPSARPGDLLRRSVTAIRHTVTELWPHTNDYGLWYFPKMLSASYLHTHEAVLHLNGSVIGSVLAAIDTEDLPAFRREGVLVGFDTMLEQTQAILANGEKQLIGLFVDGIRRGSQRRDYRASADARRFLAAWPKLAMLFERCRLPI